MKPLLALFQFDFKDLQFLLPLPIDATIQRVEVDQVRGVLQLVVQTQDGREISKGLHPPLVSWQPYAGIEE